MTARKTLDDILKNAKAKETWRKLKQQIPERDLEAIARHLTALANREGLFTWHPPAPRQARALAKHLAQAAPRVERMSLHFGFGLPLGDPAIRRLPETLVRYADALENAANNKPKTRSPDELTERMDEIVHLLVRPKPSGNRLSYFMEATHLIQAALDQASLKATVDAGDLRKRYYRGSFAYAVERRNKVRSARLPRKPDV